MISDARSPFYTSANLPPGDNPFPIFVLVHVLHREYLEDPPQGLFLQLVCDFLHGVLPVTIYFRSVLAR